MPTIAFIMGTTCSGKSSFLSFASQAEPQQVGLVEVGKMFRAKYPPSYFRGQAAPKHTALEAWEMCENAVDEHLRRGTELILVDGQPRDFEQTHKCVASWPMVPRRFVLLDCYLAEREARAEKRFDPTDKDYAQKYELAMQRLRNDMQSYYIVIAELLKLDQKIEVLDTNMTPETYQRPLLDALIKGLPLPG